jgi:hypothetical protein
MGIHVLTKQFGNETKYKLRNSMLEAKHQGQKWLTRDEVIKESFLRKFNDFLDDFLEFSMTFPNKYSNENMQRIIDKDHPLDAYYDFRTKAYSQPTMQMFYDKVGEMFEKYNIELKLRCDNELFIFNESIKK